MKKWCEIPRKPDDFFETRLYTQLRPDEIDYKILYANRTPGHRSKVRLQNTKMDKLMMEISSALCVTWNFIWTAHTTAHKSECVLTIIDTPGLNPHTVKAQRSGS